MVTKLKKIKEISSLVPFSLPDTPILVKWNLFILSTETSCACKIFYSSTVKRGVMANVWSTSL